MRNIIEVFEEKVLKEPDNIALIYKEREISYRALNDISNTLANHLIKNHNIQKDTIVSILMDRSEWMTISILGILKAGGAYLPIDSSYPKDRVEYMLSDSKSKLILCDSINLNAVEEYAGDLGIESFCVEEIGDSRGDNLNLDISSFDLAYLIYTSGTTGKPKGVMIEHGSFVNMIEYHRDSFGVISSDNVIAFASFSFDASVYETFLALLSGATLVVVSKEDILNNFLEVTQKYAITVGLINPSFLASIEPLEGFKTIISGGEKAIVSNALHYAKKCNFINAYGPTEASVCSSFYKVNPDKDYDSISIGKATVNTNMYILDDNLVELPRGIVGEIYISGKGLARGYIHQPKLTKEKFIEHPKLGRVYKSGDLARILDDGNIEYLGRVDDQIKIRGHRVELGEIENSILDYDSIKETVVLYMDNKIIAYIRGDKLELKAYLLEKLPQYMIPS
ncbi:amino acid adenylation domain-containing protein, partial [Sulfurovum sp. bin170]|uniref:amino acid adenylation domain-containing protein n=1 Tax=Sulfurovum sp. bin170 TaxID=2695268 RepID=UPI0013DFA419